VNGVSAKTEFLQKTGAINLLCVVGRWGAHRSDIDRMVDAAPATVTKRLEEAIDLGLVRHKTEWEYDQARSVYSSTYEGRKLLKEMNELDICEAQSKIREARTRKEQQVEKLISRYED
jgi:DNA-binding HxlR family transcriptional regulator